MSAALRFVPGDGPSPGSPEYYGPVPAGQLARKDLTDRAKVALAAIMVLCRGSRTWVEASVEEIALAAGHSARKARQGLAELTERRVIEWESIGDRFRVLFRLRGLHEGDTAPAPRLADAPDPAPKCVPKRVPVCVGPLVLERETEPTDAGRGMGRDSGEGSGSGPTAEDPPVSDAEIVAELVRQAADVCQVVAPADVADLVAEHGDLAVEAFIAYCRGRSVRDFGPYARKVLPSWAQRGVIATAPRPEPRQNYNPGPKYEPVPESERQGLRDWRRFVPRDNEPEPGAKKEPAAGRVGKLTPQPVGGPSPVMPNYTVNPCSRTEGDPEKGQKSPGESNPAPPPTGEDSLDHPPGPAAGGGRGRPTRGGLRLNSSLSSGLVAGAQDCGPRGLVTAGSVLPVLLRRSNAHSDPAAEPRQRRSLDAPEPHRRE